MKKVYGTDTVLLLSCLIFGTLSCLPVGLLMAQPTPSNGGTGTPENTRILIMPTTPSNEPMAFQNGDFELSITVLHVQAEMDATNVALTVVLPQGIQFLDARPLPTRVEGSRITWDIGTLTGEDISRTYELRTRVSSDAPLNAALSIDLKTTTETSSSPLNNYNIQYNVNIVPAGANLRVLSNLSDLQISLTKPTTFAIDLYNQGNIPASNVVLTVRAVDLFRLQSMSPPATRIENSTAIWELGEVSAHGGRDFSVTFSVGPIVPGDDRPLEPVPNLNLFEIAASAENEVQPQDNHLSVNPVMGIDGTDLILWSVMKQSSMSTSSPSVIKLLYRYMNIGTETARDAVITLSLSEGIRLMSSSPPPTRVNTDPQFFGGSVLWSLGEVKVGQQGLIECEIEKDLAWLVEQKIVSKIHSGTLDIDMMNNIREITLSTR